MARGTRKGSGPPAPPRDGDDDSREYRDPKAKGAFHNPFAALAGKRDTLPGTAPQVRPEDFPLTPPAQGPAQAVLRLEERGGQEVTRVEGLGLSAPELQAWLEALQRGLGCRGEVEDGTLVLRGDHRRTAPDLLLRRGVQRVRQG
jgi:translation initiation factor 1